jgi:hypothetical protein
MEFLTEGLDAAPEPDATALQAYLEAHADRYAVPARVTFTHVFARGERPPPEGAALATGWADALRRGTDPATLGDPFVRGRSLAGASEAEVAAVFGAPFAARVMGLPLGAWSGPVVSSYGQHLVRVTVRSPGRAATLADVHAAVAHDWTEERRAAARRAALDRLRAAYAVRVEPPAPGVVAAR